LDPTPTIEELLRLPVEELARMVLEREARHERELRELAARMMARIEEVLRRELQEPEV
jgi:hypothetical protein